MLYYVYLITRLDDLKQYIGTTNSDRLSERMKDHRHSDRYRNRPFTYEILYSTTDFEDCLLHETRLVQQYDTYRNGLNATRSGKGCHHDSPQFTTHGYKYTDEQRANVSKGIRAAFAERKTKGLGHWIKGIKRSAELRQRWSVVRKNKRFAPCKKLTPIKIKDIRDAWARHITLPGEHKIGTKLPNGLTLTYRILFTKYFADQYRVTGVLIKGIIDGKVWRENVTYA